MKNQLKCKIRLERMNDKRYAKEVYNEIGKGGKWIQSCGRNVKKCGQNNHFSSRVNSKTLNIFRVGGALSVEYLRVGSGETENGAPTLCFNSQFY